MIAAADLSTQLSHLSDALKSTNSLITKLAKLHFHPGSEPLEGDSVVRIELAQDIHDSLKQLEDELEVLRQEADDYREQAAQRRRRDSGAGEEARISAKVARVGEELVHSRQQFRNAQLAAKLASERAKREEREALLESYRREAEQIDTPPGETAADGTKLSATEGLFARRSRHHQQKQLSKDEILVNASTDVTAALRRTHDLLSTELSRSRFAQETFDESTAALKDLGEEYSNLDTILSNSKNLLGTLLRSQKSDTWYLETAFYILISTLSWLFFRRILFGPFVKLPLFFWNVFAFVVNWIFLKPLFAVLGAVGVITTQPVTSLSSSIVSSSTRAPLIVQPSAKGRAEPLPDKLRERVKAGAGIPAGAGRSGAKVGKDPEREIERQKAELERLREQEHILEDELSESIGRMAEDGAKHGEQQNGEENVVRRGDGTILKERGADEPRNPKKKNFEADVEDAKQEEKQKEGEKVRAKRDEL